MQHCFLLSRKSLRFLGSAMGIAIANRKNRCDFGALRALFWCPFPFVQTEGTPIDAAKAIGPPLLLKAPSRRPGRMAKQKQSETDIEIWKKGKDPHPQDKSQHLELYLGNGKSARSFQTEVFSWMSARDVCSRMLVFPGFGGPDRSFWPDVRRDIRPKTSFLG